MHFCYLFYSIRVLRVVIPGLKLMSLEGHNRYLEAYNDIL